MGTGRRVGEDPDGSGWTILADPEGNEFCVLRSDSDRAAMHPWLSRTMFGMVQRVPRLRG